MADASSFLEQLLEAGDQRLLDELRGCRDSALLGPLAPRWFADPRPESRAALLRYVDQLCDQPHHQPLVKRLFKLAEKAGDDEAMAHFLASFDRLGRRHLITRSHWDFKKRRSYQQTKLLCDRKIPARAPRSRTGRNPQTGEAVTLGAARLSIFSRRTRGYLVRRAFRYFRHLGFRDPARYRRAIATALTLYQDEQLQAPEQLLDAWGLVHALYGRSPVLDRVPGGVRLAKGRTLKELEPAPMFPDVWWDGFDELLLIVEGARCRPVRNWAIGELKRHHAEGLAKMPLPRLRVLLAASVEEVLLFAAELLKAAPGLDALPIEEWLALLRLPNLTVLTVVCDLVREHVSPDRLDLAQCVDLACSSAAPVAELGLAWAKTKPTATSADLSLLVRLGGAKAQSIRAEAMAWVAQVFAQSDQSRPDHVRDLIDAPFPDARARGLTLMLDPRFQDEPAVWMALAESPWDDVRAVLVKHLQDRAGHHRPETLRHVWASALLAVHRGGKAKRLVVRQLAERIAQAPEEATSLLKLLAVALRSIRAPERRAALAVLAQTAFSHPSLRAPMAQALPELKLFAEEAA